MSMISMISAPTPIIYLSDGTFIGVPSVLHNQTGLVVIPITQTSKKVGILLSPGSYQLLFYQPAVTGL